MLIQKSSGVLGQRFTITMIQLMVVGVIGQPTQTVMSLVEME